MEIISFDSSKKAVAKNAALGFLFQFLLKVKGLVLLPIIVHFLPKEVLGEWNLITTTISILVPVLTLNLLDGSGMFFSSDTSKESVRVKYYTIENSVFVLISVVVVIAGLLSLLVNIGIHYYFLCVLYLILSAYQKLSIMLLQTYQKSSYLVVCNFVVQYGAVVLTLLMLYLGVRDVSALIVPNLLLNAFVSGFLQIQIRKEISYYKHIDNVFLRKVLNISIPLIPVFITEWILSAIGIYFLSYFHGVSTVGVYSVMLSLASMVLVLRSTLQFFWFSTCSNMIGTNNREFELIYTLVVKTYLLFSIFLLVCYCFFSKLLILLFANESYMSIDNGLFIMVLGYMFMVMSTIWNGLLYASGAAKQITFSYIAAAMAICIVSPFLVKTLDVLGASVGYSIGNIVLFVMMLRNAKSIPVGFNSRDKFTNIILFCFVLFIVFVKFFLRDYIQMSDIVYYTIGCGCFLLLGCIIIVGKYVDINMIGSIFKHK